MRGWKYRVIAIGGICLLMALAGCASLDAGSASTSSDLQSFGVDFVRQLLAAFLL